MGTGSGQTPVMDLDLDRYRVRPGEPVDLAAWDTRDDGGIDKARGRDRTRTLNRRLELLQERLWAEHRHRVLVVLQATDTGGKDGTIRHVFDGVNPQGVRVAAFKKPTERELAHDYLWRVHPHVPGDGEIVIFNRSHYEDVLVVRVHELVPRERWERRYDHIVDFERLLVDEGTTICKFFLHISRDEQAERLRARLENPDKQWKFSRGDLAERRRWDDYQEAFRVMLERTSTPWAPWWVVPADRKWFRNLLVSEILVSTLEQLDPRWPEPTDDLDDVEIV